MRLRELISLLPEKVVLNDHNPEILGIVYDPLRVKPGYLYVAINIYTQLDKVEIPDGHLFVNDAIKAGAVALVLQEDIPAPDDVVRIVVPDSRLALSIISAKFYDYPSNRMKLIGVTGTNGKTTTTHIIESILMQKHNTGLIGTLYYKVNGKIYNSKDTTPEPPDLQEIFLKMNREYCKYCVMEVSSHGIDFHRVDGIDYEVGVWTNLSQDHLDWHRTMENYLNTKLRWLGNIPSEKHVAINTDDPFSEIFLKGVKAKVVTYGLYTSAEITAKDINLSASVTDFTLVTPSGEIDIRSKLRGEFNLYNMLSGSAAAYALDIPLDVIKSGLESEIVVAGRFQAVDKGQDFTVIIDYAHTPDGLIKVLSTARTMNPNRIITVFGCGGDRDRFKRPKMASIVEDFSDYFVITDDNPRNEDPEQIVDDILSGVRNKFSNNYKVIHDRREAIQHAIDVAKSGDLVIIAGKGHESTQTYKDRTIYFNDYEVSSEILNHKMKG